MQELIPFWPMIVSFVLSVAWGVRLESKILYLEREKIPYLEKENIAHKENLEAKDKILWLKLDAIQTTVVQLLQAVAKMEGKYENKNE